MIRYIKYAFLLTLTAVLLTVALANRETVTLTFLTPDLADLAGWNWSLDLPLFLVVFGGIVAGLLIGFVWEWLREAKHRQEVARRQQQVRDLKREVIKLRGEKHEGKDEVLALLEETPARKTG
jgi:uncharacterized integral membrane protein